MNNDLLLTGEALRLSPTLSRGQMVGATFALKCVHSQAYLVVDEQQAAVLNEFASSRTVSEVLETCIRDRTCIALREFYELVLKAYRAGILNSDQSVVMRRPAVRWFVAIRPVFLSPLFVLVFAAVAGTFILRVPAIPESWHDLAWGWLSACAGLSVGQLLATTLLRGSRCEIYRPRFRWQSMLPHFAADLRDVCMTHPLERAMVLAAPATGVAVAAVSTLWSRPEWALIPAATWLILCRPVGDGFVQKLIDLFRRKALRATDTDPLFEAFETAGDRWKSRWRRYDTRSTSLLLLYAVGWTIAVACLAYHWAGFDWRLPFADGRNWEIAGLGVLAAHAVIAVLVALHALCAPSIAAIGSLWARWRLTWRRWRSGRDAQETPASIDTVLRRSMLLRRLAPASLAQVAQEMRFVRWRAWSTIISFEADPKEVGIIVSGRMTAYRRLKSGRKVRFLQLAEGDLFGAHRLVDLENSSLEVRTNSPCTALVMSSDSFRQLVVEPLGPTTISNHVHKLIFLQHTRLCARWRPAAIARFIELAKITVHPAGTKIITEREEVRSLYVLYEGQARALHGCKQIGKIRPGEVFGEISLLQCSAATADVETIDDSRLFAVDRLDFIRFMARNHHVALQVERIASRRLGHPIFPLSTHSFEVR